MGKTSPGKIIFATTDIHGNPVRLSEGTWEHIEERHPEMAGRQGDVQDAIQDPDAQRPSNERDTCVAYEAFGYSTAPGIRVMVEYADKAIETGTTTGKVITAYPPDPRFSSKVGPMKPLR